MEKKPQFKFLNEKKLTPKLVCSPALSISICKVYMVKKQLPHKQKHQKELKFF